MVFRIVDLASSRFISTHERVMATSKARTGDEDSRHVHSEYCFFVPVDEISDNFGPYETHWWLLTLLHFQ